MSQHPPLRKGADPDQICLQKIQQYQQQILVNSGKSLTQLGLFQECVDLDQMKYGLVQMLNITTHIPLGISMGACLPKICRNELIEKQINAIFQDSDLPMYGKYIESPQQFSPKFGTAYYFAIVLISLIGLFVLFSTIFEKISKKKFRVISAFSITKSLNIFEYKEHKFNVFNGIKSLCMCWVILGHMFSVRLQNNVNALTLTDQLEGPFFLINLSAFFSVDVFFFIGGFLVAYSFLRNSMKSIMKYPLAIVHRILRFWPSYIIAMLIYYGIMMHTGSGPLWYRLQTVGQIDYCDSMWKSIIFVDNIVDNGERMCMGWGWYLQNDMQIFIASIPILYLYNRNRKISYILIQVLILLSLIYNFLQVQLNEYITIAHRIDFAKWGTYFPNVYIKPWVRCPPYLYGLTLGLLYMQFVEEEKHKKQTKGLLSKLKEKIQQRRMLKNIMQLVGLAIIVFIVVIPRTLQVGHKWPQIVHSIYLTFTKLFFVVGVSMLAMPCLLGIKNDLFFFLMDTKAFNFIAKISFFTYLIHYMVVEHVNYTRKVDFYFDTRDVLNLYIPVAIISMFFGFIGTMLVEVPFGKLQKMLFEGKKKHSKVEGEHAGNEGHKNKNAMNQSLVSKQQTSFISINEDKNNSSLATDQSIRI